MRLECVILLGKNIAWLMIIALLTCGGTGEARSVEVAPYQSLSESTSHPESSGYFRLLSFRENIDIIKTGGDSLYDPENKESWNYWNFSITNPRLQTYAALPNSSSSPGQREGFRAVILILILVGVVRNFLESPKYGTWWEETFGPLREY